MGRPVRQLVLVGLMGTGKTTTADALAGRLGWPIRDSDREIEAASGESVRVLRERLGTDRMHDLEAAALGRALEGAGPQIVCAAASTIDREECRHALRGSGIAVVWLTAEPATAAARFGSDDHRPRFGDDPETFLAAQARDREPRFRELDALQVATDELPPDAVAGVAVAGLRARGWALPPG